MSSLIVNTLSSRDASHTAFTNQEGVKARMNYNDNTPASRENFNVSSVTDVAAGKFTPNWTNNFGNANYAATANFAEDNGAYSNFGAGGTISYFNSSRATGSCLGATSVDEDTFQDMRTCEGLFVGDLA